ncbi:MAG TPA: DUF5995 family protein [Solirubrobacterales bacterium]|jgi:hypothetical protein
MGGYVRRAALAVLVAATFACLPSLAVANSLLVPNTNWTALLPPRPGAPTEPQPGPVPNCEVAGIGCIDTEIQRLQGFRDQLGCDHRAVFATTYLELTRGLRRDLDTDPGMFRDRNYLYTEDALFADIYFDTFRAWQAGGRVAPAWQIAFEQAAHGQITGAQEMLLGINAHVQNDMPFVIAALGVRTPDGASRKPDHDAVNEVLNRAYEPVVDAIRQRYDPLIGVTNPAIAPADDIAGLELVRVWRELVWRNAERLLLAKTDAQRQTITKQIETNAADWARGMAAVQVPGIRASRDGYCEKQLGQ